MTANQIAYHANEERIRNNKAMEAEAERSNRAKEGYLIPYYFAKTFREANGIGMDQINAASKLLGSIGKVI